MIYVNQMGYETKSRKYAVTDTKGICQIRNQEQQVLQKETVPFGRDPLTDAVLFLLDFSELSKEGTYQILMPHSTENNRSFHFRIGHGIYQPLENAMLKSFYFQRCGCALPRRTEWQPM